MNRFRCAVLCLLGAACLLSGAPVRAEIAVGENVSAPDPGVFSGPPRDSRIGKSFEQGRQLALRSDPRCMGQFFLAAKYAWIEIEEGLADPEPAVNQQTLQLYNAAVSSCMISAHRLAQLDPLNGLQVEMDGQRVAIPVVVFGGWSLDQINCFRSAGRAFKNPTFAKTVRDGIGAAILGVHFRDENRSGKHHFLSNHPIAITAVIRPTHGRWQVELFTVDTLKAIAVEGHSLNLSSNMAAAVQFGVDQLQQDVNPWSAFLDPEIAVNHDGILMLQPYQPGKIPVVLIHGLLSNPSTWGTLINELLHTPGFSDRFQIWAYLYPTGTPFLKSAAALRQDLRGTLAFLDPSQSDPALRNMVLIGHSMGGLLARLQVTWSGNFLWNEFAKVPLDQIRATPSSRQMLASVFFFRPQPFVNRVIFIAVPHQGSSMANRFVGCLGRILAGNLPETSEMWDEVRKNNRGLFQKRAPRRLPTSVAGLAPKSPGLVGLVKLPFAENVHLHSIIGTKGCEPICRGDSVVPIESARLQGAESEVFVHATHTGANEHPAAIQEIKRILGMHWEGYEKQNQTIAAPPPE